MRVGQHNLSAKVRNNIDSAKKLTELSVFDDYYVNDGMDSTVDKALGKMSNDNIVNNPWK